MQYIKPRIFNHSLCALVLLSLSFGLQAQLPEPQRFENAIKAFEEQDRLNAPPQGAIVLTGSSSIARWNDQAHAALAPLTVISRGFGGSVMNDVLHYLDRVALKYKPRAILIYEGDNDTGLSIPKTTILEQLNQVISQVHQKLPAARIYILAIKPSVLRKAIWPKAQEVNSAYKAIADGDPLVFYVDVATPLLKPDGSVMTDIFIGDNLHLNDKGNEIWGKTIKAALMPIEGQYE